jgi:superfamily II DNA or RNA helicase
MYSKAYIGSYLYLPREEIDLVDMVEEFTAIRKFDGDPIKMYDDSPSKFFGIPLYAHRDLSTVAKEVKDLRVSGNAINIQFLSKFWEGQEKIIDRFLHLKNRGATGFILEAPPGFGKTVTMLKMIQLVGRTTLVVVPRSNLIGQWIKRATKHTSLKESEIGIAEGGQCTFRGKKIVVGLVHSLVLDRYGKDFQKYFGCVVFDEVDRSVPPTTFAPALGMFPSKYRIGASASLKRQDGLHTVFEKHIGQHLLVGEDANRMRAKILMVEYHGRRGYVHSGSSRLMRRGMLISALAENSERNMLLTDYILQVYRSDRRCLVLSDRTTQLLLLKGLLLSRGKKDGVQDREIGFYVRSLPVFPGSAKKVAITKIERERVASNCKIILATYGMIGIGTDIQSLAAAVYATPQSEVVQIQGRIERFLEGKKAPIVVDIMDTAWSDALRWASSRQKYYLQSGLFVKRVVHA